MIRNQEDGRNVMHVNVLARQEQVQVGQRVGLHGVGAHAVVEGADGHAVGGQGVQMDRGV